MNDLHQGLYFHLFVYIHTDEDIKIKTFLKMEIVNMSLFGESSEDECVALHQT